VIGFITDKTGAASSSFSDAEWGAEARIDALNAAGGINGHRVELKIQDDASTPQGNATAAQIILTAHPIAVIEDSSFTFGGAPALNAAGIPVAGPDFDAGEWVHDSNMFSVIPPTSAPVNGHLYTYTQLINVMKMLGITKLASVGANLPSIVNSTNQLFQVAAQAGISKCYENNTLPFGTSDYTPAALTIHSAGCDGVWAPILLSSSIALAQNLKNVGSAAKLVSADVVYDQTLVGNTSALRSLAGDYTTGWVNFQNPTPGVQTMVNNLRQYTPYRGGIVVFAILMGYISADLLIKGLQMAQPNPSPATIISSLRTVGSYDYGGIWPSPMTFRGFGTPAMFPPTMCAPVFGISDQGFTSFNGGKSVCGTLVSTKA
jgi:branched-chain amino acid transport system substrate-binding protein